MDKGGGNPDPASPMRKETGKQRFKLHLLALILALALAWYSINPTPGNITRRKREDDQPDAKKREVEPALSRTPLALQLYRPRRPEAFDASPSSDEETDDFDWPEFIDG
jgi:hypothetical protein